MPTGGGGGSQTVTQKSDPWSGIQPQLLQAVGDVQNLYNNAPAGRVSPNGGLLPSPISSSSSSAASKPLSIEQWIGSGGFGAGGNPDAQYRNYVKNFKPSSVAPTQSNGVLPSGSNSASSSIPSLAPQFYPGQTVAQLAPQQNAAIDLTTQRALSGSPINQANNELLTKTLSGGFLSPDSNPWLKDTYNKASSAVQGTVNSAFGQGGRYGSGLNQDVLGKNLNNLATDIYGGNYQQERGRQLQASALAPQAANQDYIDLSALANTGQTLQGQNQQNINADIQRFDYGQQLPMQTLQNYIALLNGGGGNYRSSTSTQPYYGSNAGSALGAGLGLLGAANGIGGLLGGAGGLFGGAGAASEALPFLEAPFLFSDIRLKSDITLIGAENGYPLYAFSYNFDPSHARVIGVMAQDVERVCPEAVHEVHGFKAVDYDKIGVEFRRVH